MKDCLPSLKKEVKKYLTNLIERGFGDSTIQVTSFSEDFKTLNVHGQDEAKLALGDSHINPNITAFIDSLEAQTKTRLAKAMEIGLMPHKNAHCNVISVLFTDGHDNYAATTSSTSQPKFERDEIIPTLRQQVREQRVLPSMICIGWGEVDSKLLSEISSGTGCQYINLGGDLNMQAVLGQATQKTRSSSVLHLLQREASNYYQHLTVRDNEVRASETTFPYKSFIVNGKKVQLIPKTPNRQGSCFCFGFASRSPGNNSRQPTSENEVKIEMTR